MTRHLFLFALLLASCRHWQVVRSSDSNPLAGQTRFVMLPLLWNGVRVDGDPEAKWIAGQDADWKAEWPTDKKNAATSFVDSVAKSIGGSPRMTNAPDPSAPAITLKPSVTELSTGGFRPTVLTLAIQVLDVNGATIEEISTTVSVKNRYTIFESRLGDCATEAGENIAQFIKERTAAR